MIERRRGSIMEMENAKSKMQNGKCKMEGKEVG